MVDHTLALNEVDNFEKSTDNKRVRKHSKETASGDTIARKASWVTHIFYQTSLNGRDSLTIMSNFKGKNDLYDFGQFDTHVTKAAILILVAFVLVVVAVVIFEIRTKLPWRSQLWFVLFASFIVSIPWEWYHLYRKAFASKQAQMEKEIPKQCRPDHELQPLESLKLWITKSFTFSDDACTRYQETLLVDPIWEVSPAKAISATAATIIAQPFEHLAEAMGKSFRALFREVPIQWQPFVFTAVILIIIIIIIIPMFTLSGLQVKLPFMIITTVPALHEDNQQINRILKLVEVIDKLQQEKLDLAPFEKRPSDALVRSPLRSVRPG